MPRSPSLRVGSTLLILGLIICQFGLLMTLHPQISLIDQILNIMPDAGFVELIGVLLQLLGGVLVATGLVISVSAIVEIKLEDERRSLLTEFLSVREARISGAPSPQAEVSSATRRCKFCGTALTEGAIFCSSCGKSQK
ncbi:MAG: zinc ribbon domain-containing protein [Candidatus Bathycorpusculaceae bacterium]